MDITEIHNQRLSTILTDFMICESCGIVDRDRGRMIIGYQCPRCGIPGSIGRIYFPLPIQSLIDLMQEFYHSKLDAPLDSEASGVQRPSNHQLAVVIFFCTLGEVLFEHFIREFMFKKELPRMIQDRLLNDNPFVKQRIKKLFPALTGAKWNETIEKLSRRDGHDYVGTVRFYRRASDARNKFLHKGNKWAIPRDMPEQCIKQVWPLISLFVALHNEHLAAMKGVSK